MGKENKKVLKTIKGGHKVEKIAMVDPGES